MARSVVGAAASDRDQHAFVVLTLVVGADVAVVALASSVTATLNWGVNTKVVHTRVISADVAIGTARIAHTTIGDLLIDTAVDAVARVQRAHILVVALGVVVATIINWDVVANVVVTLIESAGVVVVALHIEVAAPGSRN